MRVGASTSRRIGVLALQGAFAAHVHALERLGHQALEVRDADLTDGIPEGADIVVALHACGSATDALLDGATKAGARWIVCAPCCYGVQIPGYAAALDEAARYGDAVLAARHAALAVDAARLGRLRAAGYEAGLRAFTAPTVSPHNVAFVARRGGQLPSSSAA